MASTWVSKLAVHAEATAQPRKLSSCIVIVANDDNYALAA